MNFNEKTHEFSAKQGKEIPVWVSPKYMQTRKKALEIIEKYEEINEGDFWILMNETKSGKMAYTGLIISHNACCKLNERQPKDKQFVASSLSLDKDGYKDSLVYTYCNDRQGLYEVGEVSKDNCKNSYPYAMALKRCFDRVVLKLSGLAYDGVYSDSEADEFRKQPEEPKAEPKEETFEDTQISPIKAKTLKALCEEKGTDVKKLCEHYKVKSIEALSMSQYAEAVKAIEKKHGQK